jgi:hypothetical protein
MTPHGYIHLIFDKEAKNTQWRKERLSTKISRKTGYLLAEN